MSAEKTIPRSAGVERGINVEEGVSFIHSRAVGCQGSDTSVFEEVGDVEELVGGEAVGFPLFGLRLYLPSTSILCFFLAGSGGCIGGRRGRKGTHIRPNIIQFPKPRGEGYMSRIIEPCFRETDDSILYSIPILSQ